MADEGNSSVLPLEDSVNASNDKSRAVNDKKLKPTRYADTEDNEEVHKPPR